MDIIVKGQIYYLEVLVTDANGKGEADLNVDYEIFRSDNDKRIDSGSLTDVGAGVYKKGIIFSDLGQHRILYTFDKIVVDELGNIVVDEIGNIVVCVLPGSYPDTIQGVMVIEEDITIQTIKEKIDGLAVDVNFIKNIEGGKWELKNNQMIFYDTFGTVEIMRFNLFDQDDVPSMENVFKRERV